MASEPHPRDDRVTYRRYCDGDEHAILELYNSVFERRQTLAQWRWAYRCNPVGRTDIVLAFRGSQLIAQAAGIPLVLSHEGRLVHASRIQNVFVHPDSRGRGVFTDALMLLTRRLAADDVDFVLTFPNNNSLAAFLNTRAYAHAFDIFQLELNAAGGITTSPGGVNVELEDPPVFGQTDVEFIRRELAPFGIHNARGLPYLTWRYHRDSGTQYRVARTFHGAEQVGFAVVKPYPAAGSIDLVELIVRNDETIVRSTLRAILAAYQNEQLHAFNVWSMEHYPLQAALLRIGFKRSACAAHAVYKVLSARCSQRCGAAAAYYLSMGDSDVY